MTMPRPRRGRKSNVRTINRQRTFKLAETLVKSRMAEAYIAGEMHHLSSWKNENCALSFERVGLLVGEIMIAGIRERCADTPPEAANALLPFSTFDACRAARDGGEAVQIFVDLLHRNVWPLWRDRGLEAMEDPNHRYHSYVQSEFGLIVRESIKAAQMLEGKTGLAGRERGDAPEAVPSQPEDDWRARAAAAARAERALN